MEKQKWKFFYNGYTWWLRIESVEQLIRYFELTDENRFGGAMMTVAHHRMGDIKGHYDGKYDGIAGDLDALNSILKEDLLTTTGRLRLACHDTGQPVRGWLLVLSGHDVNHISGLESFVYAYRLAVYLTSCAFDSEVAVDIEGKVKYGRSGGQFA